MSLNSAITSYVRECRSNDFSDNWDKRRFGAEPLKNERLGRKIENSVKKMLGRYREPELKAVMQAIPEIEFLYDRLADDESKTLLVQLLGFRALGHRKVKLPLNSDDYWNTLARIEASYDTQRALDTGFKDWVVQQIDLEAFGHPIQLYARPSGVMTQIILQQYRCETATDTIEASPGDTVIDAGGCYGDTALHFSNKVGAQGRVFSFEFMPDNLKVFRANLKLNPELAERINVIERAIWSAPGERLHVESKGPASRVSRSPFEGATDEVETQSIDGLVAERTLERVDFIKMDIEGAEMQALEGSETTIRRFRPKLGISVYHNLDDFYRIPRWIDSLGLDYAFHLRHFTIHAEETILFATPR